VRRAKSRDPVRLLGSSGKHLLGLDKRLIVLKRCRYRTSKPNHIAAAVSMMPTMEKTQMSTTSLNGLWCSGPAAPVDMLSALLKKAWSAPIARKLEVARKG
jgi:hypothetical protein